MKLLQIWALILIGIIGSGLSSVRAQAVPAVQGSWTGTIENDGTTLTGTWNQGSPLLLTSISFLCAAVQISV